LFAGCGTVDPRPDQELARAQIRETTGYVEVFDPDAPPLSSTELEADLADGLGLDEATRLALLNNRHLQAGFLALGVGRADYVQAGLLQNPSLSLGFLFPAGGGRSKFTADLAASVTQFWELPLRKDAARADLDRQILELSRFAGDLVAMTREVYCECVAAREARATALEGWEITKRLLAAVQAQVAGGVAKQTDENLAKSQTLSAELSYRATERAGLTSLRRLAALLSVDTDLRSLTLTDGLPDPVVPEAERELLVERSLERRLDLRAAAAAITAAEARVALERRRVVPGAEVGVSLERPEGGASTDLLSGSSGAIVLPLFAQNRARIGRAEYRRDELIKEHEALPAEASQEVRAALDRAVTAGETARFIAEELLPQAERSAELARTAYELGDTTSIALLESQRAALLARSARIDALLEAALARVDLERRAAAPFAALLTEIRPFENSLPRKQEP
jgi:cobalt-zinc-cadmium efflux system outer membrane protein